MKTLIRCLVAAVVFAVVGGVAPAAAQRVAVDIHLGAPGVHYRQYRHGHRMYRQFYRPYVRHYAPRAYYRRPVMLHRQLRVQRHRHHQWY